MPWRLLRNACLLSVLTLATVKPTAFAAAFLTQNVSGCPSCGDCTCCGCQSCSKSWTGSCSCKGCSQ